MTAVTINDWTLSIWDNKDAMLTVWKVKDFIIWIDPASKNGDKTSIITKVNCTIFKKKKNKVISALKFDFDEVISKDDALIRIKAHLICDGIIWELNKDAFGYIFKVKNWKQTIWKSKFDVVFDLFDQNFRLLLF